MSISRQSADEFLGGCVGTGGWGRGSVVGAGAGDAVGDRGGGGGGGVGGGVHRSREDVGGLGRGDNDIKLPKCTTTKMRART